MIIEIIFVVALVVIALLVFFIVFMPYGFLTTNDPYGYVGDFTTGIEGVQCAPENDTDECCYRG